MDILSDKVEEIVDALNKLSLENQRILHEIARNTSKAGNSEKKSAPCASKLDKKIEESPGDAGLKE